MHRLPCGVIYTNAFAEHLASLDAPLRTTEQQYVLSLEYLRLTKDDGQQEDWWQMNWVPEKRTPLAQRFTIGSVPVSLSKQTQLGLKHRCLDWRNGSVVVKS
jgi:hypothetical protein